ncbi:PadR family transcriptional regulator [Halalkalirubrum salinum]|uniref:PadR family transcriptional regulator n=1 Tax=Halalkalirubrum salinum TaxID=2563889 RepID=UPI0014851639|nr:PadR family transcriptional regulator [Halalkalirubrum salinum]
MFELTGFQRDLLYVAAGLDHPSGQTIGSELQKEIDTITHGRLYPNLDTLVELGYLEQGRMDKRTNYYELTEAGKTALEERRSWENQYVDLTD